MDKKTATALLKAHAKGWDTPGPSMSSKVYIKRFVDPRHRSSCLHALVVLSLSPVKKTRAPASKAKGSKSTNNKEG